MCVDSRVPLKGDGEWYHETECRYNPFISKWDDEPGYLNLSDSGITVSAAGNEINKTKLMREFKKAWSI